MEVKSLSLTTMPKLIARLMPELIKSGTIWHRLIARPTVRLMPSGEAGAGEAAAEAGAGAVATVAGEAAGAAHGVAADGVDGGELTASEAPQSVY